MPDSKLYFAEVAEEWDALRSGFFTEAMRDAAIAKVGLISLAVVADVGTGTGFVLQGLLSRAAFAVGFDESTDMLAVAARNLAGRNHVVFCASEGDKLPAADGSFDAVFANMYLHHTLIPAAAIAEMARVLRVGGKLVITDLDSHDQAWMKEAMADRWLGFAREDIAHWFRAAGLAVVDLDCAEGTCDCTAPGGDGIALSIFLAIGEKTAPT